MLATLAALTFMTVIDAPAPCLPIPTPRQMAWHRMETYAFVHFGPNTFTDREWGEGKEDPKLFAPTALDAEQWVRAFKEAGFKMVILTAKHHDGFCLWPSKQSTHTVAQSGYKGDVLGEVAKAAKKHGLKLGVYLSPWDRNHPNYGTDAYNDTFVKSLEEVLTNYGVVHEVWFDGANGEGPNGKRQVYDWPRFWETVRRLQPNACMFSDGGPDVRWVGNESGYSAETCWAMLPSGKYLPGVGDYKRLPEGFEDGDLYIPAECDVSIRPGWFYHASQDSKVKTVSQLIDLYFRSVGQNSNFLLNVPPDRRGLIHETDVQRLRGFGKWVKAAFEKDLARGARVAADVSRGKGFEAARVTDGKDDTYWAAPDDSLQGQLTLTFKGRQFDVVSLQEFVELGQRVKSFTVEARVDQSWVLLWTGTTIGYKRLLRLANTVDADGLRVTILDSRACPTLRSVGLFASPDIIKRDIANRVKRDQAARSKIDWQNPNMADVHALEVIDLTNLAYLKELVKKHGWLGSSMLGVDGAHNLWLLTQHCDADPAFQEQCLGLMAKAVSEGEASGSDFAYLTDRVLRSKKQPQRFGTQLSVNRRGEYVMQECEDVVNLDRRRAALGMEPMSEYLRFVKLAYDPRTSHFADKLGEGWKEIKQTDDGSFDLPAKLGKVLGSKAAYEEATDSIGYWTAVQDQVGWIVDVRDRGTYALTVQYACDPANAGSVVEIQVAGETKRFTVKATKGWSDFVTVDLGTVSLVTTGPAEVRVRPLTMPNGAVMNLRSLRLARK